MDENASRQESEVEVPPRDSQDSRPSSENDTNRRAWQSDVLFDELPLPGDTMNEFERDPRAAIAAFESAQESPDHLREGRDGLILIENQPLDRQAENQSLSIVDAVDPEEQQLHERLIALLERRSFYTPDQDFESTLERGYNALYERLEDDPSLPRYFQQAIAGLTTRTEEPDRSPEMTRTPISEQGMIPITTPSPVHLLRSETSGTPEPNLLSQNLLGILERPSFISSPLPRWTAPPQWLQFQTLQSYEEGLMINESQDTTNANAYSTYTEETRTQIQSNFQGLLANRLGDAANSAPPQRWQQSEQWLQASLDDDIVPPVPSMRFDEHFDDGLITAPPRVNDPSSTPSVTCSFGLMQKIGYGERNLEFFPETFSAIDAPFFRNRVRSQASNTTDLMFIVITDWQPWFKKSLQEALPDFPIQTLSNFSSPQVSSMLPSIDYNEGELTCIMEHISSHRKPREKFTNEREIDIGSAKARCLPLVVWTRALGAIESHPDRPVIVVISKRTNKMSSKIINHYSNDRYKRWDRLTKNQAWIYLDLYFLFTKWDRIWAAVKLHQQKRTEEVYARQNVVPIVQQTRQLHKDNNIMISLREHVRIHKASLRIVMQRVEYMLGGVDFMATQGLKGRLDDAYQVLEYYEVTATTLLEQQQNLLSLAFNLETIAQGAAVARLNALAFVFLPLSFVASVFGITTFTAAPKWYPVAAVPVLLSTIIIAYAANRFFTSKTMKEPIVEDPEPPMPYDDIEKMPNVVSVVSTSSWKQISKRMRRRSIKISGPIPTPRNLWASEITSMNDPSRLIRRSTDRSLAGQSYVPPRSTVQFIPGAYDLSSVAPSFYSPAGQISGSASYNFATGGSGPSAYLDDPYSQVSQLSSTYSPGYQEYRPGARTNLADGTTSQPYELGNSYAPPPLSSYQSTAYPAYFPDDGDTEAEPRVSAPPSAYVPSYAISHASEVSEMSHMPLSEYIVPPGVVDDGSRVVRPIPATTYPIYHENGDNTGYRPDAPDSFGLPPEGFSSSFAGKTLDDLASSSAPPASRRFGAVFGDLDDLLMAGESSGTSRLEPIPEEDDNFDVVL